MAPTSYVAEDDLVGHQWKKEPLVLPRLDTPVWGNVRVARWEGGVVREEEHPYGRRGKGMR